MQSRRINSCQFILIQLFFTERKGISTRNVYQRRNDEYYILGGGTYETCDTVRYLPYRTSSDRFTLSQLVTYDYPVRNKFSTN